MFVQSFDDIPQGSKICVYGKGSRAQHFKNFINLFRKDTKIVGSLDSSSLNEFLKKGINYDFIVIASVYWIEIKKTLDEYKINNYKILANELAGFMQGYWIYTDKNEKYSSKFSEAMKIFKLESHRKLYELLYNYRMDNEPLRKIIEYSIKNMDRLKDHYLEFLVRDEVETIIEGGVFDGTSTNRLIGKLKNVKNVFGFEPLKDKLDFNYPELINTEKLARLEIYPEGLWHKAETLGFNICQGGSAITESKNAEVSIKTIAMDEWAKKNSIPKIDFIKMDIEDAELNALKGGLKTIKKDRPQMAICIYHSLDQFIEIPLFLKSNLENYSYYLGHYFTSNKETVLYAIPKEIES